MPGKEKKDIEYFLKQLEFGKGKKDVLTVVYFAEDLQMKRYKQWYEISEDVIGKEATKRLVTKESIFRKYRCIAGMLEDCGREMYDSDACFLKFSVVIILTKRDNPLQAFIEAENKTLPNRYQRFVPNATYSRINADELKEVKFLTIPTKSEQVKLPSNERI